jgi:hypothetical protein
MTNERDLSPLLEGLERPDPRHAALKSQLRLALLDARASSRVGFALVFAPAAFVFGVILHYGFGLPVPGFSALESGLEWVEKQPYIPLLAPLLLVGAPLLALCLNTLAITHIHLDRPRREVSITLKLRALNLLVMATAAFVVAIVCVHVIAERAHHLP